MRLARLCRSQLDLQRGHLFPWAPVCLGTGIALYFALRFEPAPTALMGTAAILAALALACPRGSAARLVFLATFLVSAGAGLASLRAHLVAEPRLGFRYYGPVEGRIVAIDRSLSDATRLTLDRVVLYDVGAGNLPARVRVSLHGDAAREDLSAGATVIMTAHLAPPSGPAEPGGFDFRRHAWFQRLGAVGYTRTPVLVLEPDAAGGPLSLRLARTRLRISAAVRAALPDRAGAFVAAITTGDRSAMDRETLDALRASNLAHLLAISGLHMGLLTGFVFAAIRVLIAGIPVIALRIQSKKPAAIAALLAGLAYLAMSGGNVATERAFVMVSVMFLAVLADRRAITMRGLALAAMTVLALRPESLLSPGFQMSFAATAGLVAVFGWMRDRSHAGAGWPRPLRFLGGVALSSAVAGAATAPFAAAHFNQLPHYGLLANMLAVPLMGLAVIPAAVLTGILWLFGLSGIGLAAMGIPAELILAIADEVAGWPGAVSRIRSPQPAVLPIVALAGLWLILWRGTARAIGVPGLAAAVLLWVASDRPPVLVAQSGGLIGVRSDTGRSLSKPRGDGFTAAIWLENDGDPASQRQAADRPGLSRKGAVTVAALGERRILHATGKRAAAEALASCKSSDLVIVNVPVTSPAGCALIDRTMLAKTGALAIRDVEGRIAVDTVSARQGVRLWTQ